jgi:hypothetical protein
VLGEQVLERGEGVGRHVKVRRLDVREECVELRLVHRRQQQRCEPLVPRALAQHDAVVEGELRRLVAPQQDEEHVAVLLEPLDGLVLAVLLSSKQVGEDLRDVLAALEVEERQVGEQQAEDVALPHLARQLGRRLGVGPLVGLAVQQELHAREVTRDLLAHLGWLLGPAAALLEL